MIYNQTVLEFGSGDICMETFVDEGNVGVIRLQNVKPGIVGRTSSDSDLLDVDDLGVIMLFENIESLDVVMDSLKFLRKKMKRD